MSNYLCSTVSTVQSMLYCSMEYKKPESADKTLRELVQEFSMDKDWEVKPTNVIDGFKLAADERQSEAFVPILSRNEGYILALREFELLVSDDDKRVVAQATIYDKGLQSVEDAIVLLKDGKIRLYRDTNFEQFTHKEDTKLKAVIGASILAGAATVGSAIYLLTRRQR